MQNDAKALTTTDSLPPQDLEAERALLGLMMMSWEATEKAAAILVDSQPGYSITGVPRRQSYGYLFSSQAHEVLFERLVIMGRSPVSYPVIDLIIVSDYLRRHNLLDFIGGQEYMIQLAESFPEWGDIEHYAQIVRAKGMLRKAQKAAPKPKAMPLSVLEAAQAITDEYSQCISASAFGDCPKAEKLLANLLDALGAESAKREAEPKKEPEGNHSDTHPILCARCGSLPLNDSYFPVCSVCNRPFCSTCFAHDYNACPECIRGKLKGEKEAEDVATQAGRQLGTTETTLSVMRARCEMAEFGPWKYEPMDYAAPIKDQTSYVIMPDDGGHYHVDVAHVIISPANKVPPELAEARARLFCAAPDLLAFAKEFVHRHPKKTGDGRLEHLFWEATTAITKAIGRGKRCTVTILDEFATFEPPAA